MMKFAGFVAVGFVATLIAITVATMVLALWFNRVMFPLLDWALK